MLKAQFIEQITIVQDDKPVEVSIYVHPNGGVFGVDSSFVTTELPTYCPFTGKRIELNED